MPAPESMMRRALFLFVVVLTSCGPEPPCDVDLLRVAWVKAENTGDPAAAARGLVATCDATAFPPALWGWVVAAGEGKPPPADAEALWAEQCSVPLAELYRAPLVDARSRAHQLCGLPGTPEDTAWSDGDPFLAHAMSAFLASLETVDPILAVEAVSALRGPAHAPVPNLPTVVGPRSVAEGWAIPAEEPVSGILERLRAEPADLAFRLMVRATDDQGRVDGLASVTIPTTSRLDGTVILADRRGFEIAEQSAVRAASECGVAVCGNPADSASRDALAAALPGQATTLVVDGALTTGTLVALHERFPSFELYAPLGFASCNAHDGMRCVPGGPKVFSGAGERRLVTLSTFWIDPSPASGADFRSCVTVGACPAQEAHATQGDVATGARWYAAVQHCAEAGKRLPTEWEWEAGVGTSPDPEWTSTWKWTDRAKCSSCEGPDPLGPCEASHPCTGQSQRVVRGGSGSRGFVAHASWPPDVAFRCATDLPYLTSFPPKVTARTWAPTTLESPKPAELALFHGIPDDPIEEKPLCDEAKRAQLDCRDPQSYVTPNETREHVYRRFLTARGGGYVGVASDQNYSFAAVARSEWVWLLDYDPQVVRLHQMLEPLILAADTPEKFVDLFSEAQVETAAGHIRAHWKEDPEVETTVLLYRRLRTRLVSWYTRSTRPGSEDDQYGWLRVPEHYAYIRLLHQQDRIHAVKGDMLASRGALYHIGEAARNMGIPIRVYYTSNAPDAWGGIMTPEYRENVRNLPMDDESVVLQVFGFQSGFGQTGYWHFNVQSGLQQQARLGLEGYNRVWELVTERVRTDDVDVTIQGLPGG